MGGSDEVVAVEVKLEIKLSGTWADDIDPEEIDSLKEEIEGEARYSGGHGITVEVERV